MTAIDIGGFAAPLLKATPSRARKSRQALRRSVRRVVATLTSVRLAWQARREKAQMLRRLRTLDDRTLRDMGFDPAEIFGGRAGTWQAEHGDAWRGLDR